jgi:hypothetical protein
MQFERPNISALMKNDSRKEICSPKLKLHERSSKRSIASMLRRRQNLLVGVHKVHVDAISDELG